MTKFLVSLLLFICATSVNVAQIIFPRPDHTVVLILENHSYSMITGTTHAPYIHSLIHDPYSAVFINSYALTHPSQPNYIDLYSGCNQGIVNNNYPLGTPFSTPNLGRQLVDSGFTFVTYAEDLPVVGYDGDIFGAYVRKHNPVTNWMGFGANQLPASVNQPFTAFPSLDFTQLPTVSFVIPNLNNDMHDGTDPTRITQGDTWVNTNLSAYIEWAKTHNSLFILHYDEDDYTTANHILTVFTGQDVVRGYYPEYINHYNVLRTIEAMYGLPPICNAATVSPIIDCWKTSSVNPIPIELIDFTAHSQGNHNIIYWKTATEINSDYFTLEHSADANSFTTVENIEAQGNSTTTANYSVTDKQPFYNSTFYRLKLTDNNGNLNYSSIIEIKNHSANFTFDAVVSHNTLMIQAVSENKLTAELKILSLLGEEISHTNFQIQQGTSTNPVDISFLNSGIYFVHLCTDNFIYNKKIIIN